MNQPIATETPRPFDCAVGTRLMCAALMLSPVFFPRSGRRYSAVPVLLGFVGFATSFLVNAPSATRGDFSPSRELSEAVADPDITRAPHFWSHID